MPRTENLTILFTDMVGFTERTANQSRSQNRIMLRQLNRLLQPAIRCFRGKKIKSIGDSLLLAFRSPTDAVHCGMAMHDHLARHNRELPVEEQLQIRVAINLGEVRVEKGDLFGEAVNIAARVEAITPATEIYFTEAVYLAMNKAEVPSELLGEHRLKGIPEPVRVYRVPPGSVHRLVVAGSDNTSPDLPYGGLYLTQSDSLDWRLRLRKSAAGRLPELSKQLFKGERRRHLPWALAAGLLLAAVAYTATRIGMPIAPPEAQAGAEPEDQPLVAASVEASATQVEQREERAEQQARRQQARELMDQGHQQYFQGLRGDAIGTYERALALNPELRTEPELIDNLVESLGRVTKLSRPLIEKYPSEALLKAIGKRSGEDGPYGRGQATAILRSMGRPDLIDHVGQAIIALNESDACNHRLAAIKRLRQLGDPRALPYVEAQLEGGFSGWLRNRCLKDYAEQTVKELRTRTKPAAQSAPQERPSPPAE